MIHITCYINTCFNVHSMPAVRGISFRIHPGYIALKSKNPKYENGSPVDVNLEAGGEFSSAKLTILRKTVVNPPITSSRRISCI